MAKSNESNIEENLRALYGLQLIDSKVDEIKNVRGELPLEVEDLDDEIVGLSTRKDKLKEQIKGFESDIEAKKQSITESKALIKKYNEQQKKVRNNREFDSINKEVEYQELEIQLAEKHIKEFQAKIALKKETTENTNEKLKIAKEHLSHKKSELDSILKETENEEKMLGDKLIELESKVDAHLLKAYQKIRKSVRNGLAVVPIIRGASGGSFLTIPPQKQLEIATRKRIIIDEQSGRILVDAALAQEERDKMEEMLS